MGFAMIVAPLDEAAWTFDRAAGAVSAWSGLYQIGPVVRYDPTNGVRGV